MEQGKKEFGVVIGIGTFYILIWVVITQMYTFIKTLLNYMFIVCVLYCMQILPQNILKFKNLPFNKIGLETPGLPKLNRFLF